MPAGTSSSAGRSALVCMLAGACRNATGPAPIMTSPSGWVVDPVEMARRPVDTKTPRMHEPCRRYQFASLPSCLLLSGPFEATGLFTMVSRRPCLHHLWQPPGVPPRGPRRARQLRQSTRPPIPPWSRPHAGIRSGKSPPSSTESRRMAVVCAENDRGQFDRIEWYQPAQVATHVLR